MMTEIPKAARLQRAVVSAAALSLIFGLGVSSASAGEAEAKAILKAMSDYLAAQKAISFGIDADFEVVTKDHQKLSWRIRARSISAGPTRSTPRGPADSPISRWSSTGKTLTMLGKDRKSYVQADVPGTVDHLIDELRDSTTGRFPGQTCFYRMSTMN